MLGAAARICLSNDRGRLRLPVIALMLAAVLLPALARHFTPLADANLAVYTLTYDAGFVRRALLGSLLGPVEDAGIFARRVGVAGLMVLGLNAALVFVIALRAARAQPVGGHVIALVVCAAPLTLGYVAWDLGRPEHAGYVLVLALCLGMVTTPLDGRWLAGAMGAVTLLGVAIHEAFVLVSMPLLLAVHQMRAHPGSRDAGTTAGIAALGVVAAGLVVWLGTPSPQLVQAHGANLRGSLPNAADAVAAQAHGLRDGMAAVGDALGTPRNIKGLLAAALVIAIVGALIALALRQTVPPHDVAAQRAEWRAFALAGLPPVLMCALDPDMTRWLAYATLNVLVVACLVLARRDPTPTAERDGTPAWIPVLYAVVFLAVLPRWNMFGGIDMPDLLQAFVTDCLIHEPPKLAACTR